MPWLVRFPTREALQHRLSQLVPPIASVSRPRFQPAELRSVTANPSQRENHGLGREGDTLPRFFTRAEVLHLAARLG